MSARVRTAAAAAALVAALLGAGAPGVAFAAPVIEAFSGPAVPAATSGECTASTRITEQVTALGELQSEAAWTITRGAGVVVAVVDSGVAANPHLANAVVRGVNLVPDGTDPSGRTDTYGHGTAIAGQIAARRISGSGVEGLAPEARILPVRVFAGTSDQEVDAGFGPDVRRMAAGIRYAGNRFIDQLQQMRAAGMAVAEGAFHHDLGLGQVLCPPAHAHAQRVHFRCDLSNFLTFQTLSNIFYDTFQTFVFFIKQKEQQPK